MIKMNGKFINRNVEHMPRWGLFSSNLIKGNTDEYRTKQPKKQYNPNGV